ncbi:MAG TPA: hypothetical protein VE462_02015 [Propionibacteriaceae bacterium]|jgi:hypothetical protein|nr:hypothetical protein [Propionibacteriaceae bacterium]
MYPSLLNERRITRRGLVGIRRITPLFSLLFVAGGALWLVANDRLGGQLVGIAIACGVNAVVQASLWFRAVAAEAGGNAIWIAGVALPANVLAVIVLILPWTTPAITMIAMTCGLILGNAGLLIFMALRRVGNPVLDSVPDPTEAPGASLWFLSLASISFLGQTVLQSLAVLLPASSITLLNVAYKIVGSVSATFVNAVMPVIVHQRTDSSRSARQFLRIVTVAVATAGTLLVFAVWVIRPDLLVPSVVIAIWLTASAAAAVAGRMSFRFLAPHASIRTIGVVVTVVTLAAFSSGHPDFSLIVLLCAYAAMDGAAAMLLLWPLKDRLMSVVLAGEIVCICAIWASNYV